METTGIVRKTDDLGRIVLPAELREKMGIRRGDYLEIFPDGELIHLRKYEPACVLCAGSDELAEYRGKKVCRECVEMIRGRLRQGQNGQTGEKRGNHKV